MNKQKRTKQEKGITLVALIITIIVLLILAVVAIQAVKGDGIIKHAKNASTSYKEATVNEQMNLKFTALKMDMLANPGRYSFTLGDDGTDTGVIYNALYEAGFIVDDSYLDNKKAVMFGDNLMLRDDGETYVVFLDCKDENGNEVTIGCQMNMLSFDDENITFKLTDFYEVGELSKTILYLNADIQNNSSNYITTGTGDAVLEKTFAKLFEVLTTNEIEIEEYVLNEEKTGFNVDALLSNAEQSGGSIIVNFNCTKGGETLNIDTHIKMESSQLKIEAFVMEGYAYSS